jgi:hypothetical protein
MDGEWGDESYWYEAAIMSETDWRLAYCAPGEPNPTLFRAARRVHDLLHGELRADLYAIARQLIQDQGSARTGTAGAA